MTAFATAQGSYADLSSGITNIGGAVLGIFGTSADPFGQGKAATSHENAVSVTGAWAQHAAETCAQIAEVLAAQAEADAALAAAPTKADVERAKEALVQATADLAAGKAEPDAVDAAREEYQRIDAERKAAVAAHAEACQATLEALELCGAPPVQGGGGQDNGEGGRASEGGTADAPSASPRAASNMGTMSNGAGDTTLTSDGNAMMTGGQQPMLSTPQQAGVPQQPAMQPMQQPQPQTGANPGAFEGKRDTAAAARAAAARQKERDKDANPRADLDGLFMPIGGGAGGTGTGGTVDRGSSINNVTTERTIDGKGVNQSANLSGNTAPNPNGGNANSQQGMMRGGGGMPMGGMGAGANMGGNAVAKPTILSTAPDPLLREQTDQAVAGGALSRENADQPSKVEDEERKK